MTKKVSAALVLGLLTALVISLPGVAQAGAPTSSGVYGPWRVADRGFIANANSIVANENMFNDPPGRGMQYVIVKFRFTYEGAGRGEPYWDLDLSLYCTQNRRYYDDAGAQVIPNDWSDIDGIGRGGSATGWVLFEVPRSCASARLLKWTAEYF